MFIKIKGNWFGARKKDPWKLLIILIIFYCKFVYSFEASNDDTEEAEADVDGEGQCPDGCLCEESDTVSLGSSLFL